MSNIMRLYEAARAACHKVSYVRVPNWNLRTTWEAHARDNDDFTFDERDAIYRAFAGFAIDEAELAREWPPETLTGDVGAAGAGYTAPGKPHAEPGVR